jgi:hypothetical protein
MAKSFNKVPPVLGENFLKPFITHALKIWGSKITGWCWCLISKLGGQNHPKQGRGHGRPVFMKPGQHHLKPAWNNV